jgi:hypothetical protein
VPDVPCDKIDCKEITCKGKDCKKDETCKDDTCVPFSCEGDACSLVIPKEACDLCKILPCVGKGCVDKPPYVPIVRPHCAPD